MSPTSTQYSTEAHNGSCYSISAYPATSEDARNSYRQQRSYHSSEVYRDQAGSTTEHQEQTQAARASCHSSGGQSASDKQHRLPTYNPETPRYENEIAFEEEHETAVETQYSQRNGYTHQAPASNHGCQTGQTNRDHSPTTQRWSSEHSPEERLRLGLPRFETAEERRNAYQSAGFDYEARRDH
ncbi:hypothetical protein BUE80_DR007310 [Diplocarpon rosae]|nr:hypothetical protein BUE80_DR007310 [Diplocarpon rosae]